MKQSTKIQSFADERDEALKSLDVEQFKKFVRKWFPEKSGKELPKDEILERSMRVMMLECTRISIEDKLAACEWLLDHGHQTTIAGDKVIDRYLYYLSNIFRNAQKLP